VEHADAGSVAIRREEQIALAVDQDTGDAREVWQRAYERGAAAVDHIDRVHRGVSDVEATAGRIEVRVGVVERGGLAPRQLDESHRLQTHAGLASTFFWQYA
jgi:hypothetical protein